MTSLLWYPGHEVLLTNIVRAENCSLFDAQGKRYVDLESGVWCATIGHGNPRVRQAMTDQAARLAHTGFNYTSETVEDAAREMLSLLGLEGGKCVFLCSGSEAVEYGVRLAQTVSENRLLMTMSDSYFGAYGSASEREADSWFVYDWLGCRDCPDAADGSKDCAHWAAIPFDRIGGFLLEPGSSSGFVRFSPDGMIRAIVDRVRKAGGLILVNEVTTGVGRTGEWFGHQHYGFSPDIVAVGKSIGNGYPVSVTAFAPGVVERLGGGPLKYAQSHQNDPLGATVVREVIRTIREDGLIERSKGIAEILMTGLETIRERTGKIREVRGRGLMIAIDLEDDPETAHRELVNRGYLVALRPGSATLRLDPALTVDRGDIDGFLETLEKVLTGD
jgi:acetylornithine/N-succinyldiaminopimelate aminotransferase